MLMLFRDIIIGILLAGSVTLENLYSFTKYTDSKLWRFYKLGTVKLVWKWQEAISN